MLRVPLRLAADLARARIAQKLRRNAEQFPVLPLAPVQQTISVHKGPGENSTATIPGTELLATVRKTSAPVVWIGGPEPLLHPEMGQLTRCLSGIGRHVFLETDGALLRRRIHEFRPASRLFLTARLDGFEASHDFRAGCVGAFDAAIDGLRAARLSGFLLCVHARVDAGTDLAEIARLVGLARSLDVDGFIISPAAASPSPVPRDRAALQLKLAEARQLIGNSWWESFSWLLEPVLSSDRNATPVSEETKFPLEQESGANEEGVNVA
jgi:hypothetical protein